MKLFVLKFYFELWKDTPYWLIFIYLIFLSANFHDLLSFDAILLIGFSIWANLIITSTFTSTCKNIATKFRIAKRNSDHKPLKKYILVFFRFVFFTVVNATFVTLYELLTQAFFYEFYLKYGYYFPLIIISCQVLGRFGAYSTQNSVKSTFLDSFFMGAGFLVFIVLANASSKFIYQFYPWPWIYMLIGISLLMISIAIAKIFKSNASFGAYAT